MLLPKSVYTNNELRTHIRSHYRCDEASLLEALLPLATLDCNSQGRVSEQALALARSVRDAAKSGSNVQGLLNQYALSTNEGVVLMCLAEALLRVPDSVTADRLIRDRLVSGDWASHIGGSDSLFVNSSAWGLLISGRVVSLNVDETAQHLGTARKLVGKLGEPVIRKAMRIAMGVMGTQFVLGRSIEEAIGRAAKLEGKGYRYSYDMLGEAARTMGDADGYFKSYQNAIEHIGANATDYDSYSGAGISVKLSAIHPRYEFSQSDRVMSEMVPRLKSLALMAKARNIGLTIDAEEADRLDLSLDVIEAVFSDPDLDGWEGFGVVVQAYQKRALPVLQWVIDLSRRVGRKIMLRLVKGAYWDSEIKIAQVEGLDGYPVFTRKASTDVSYQACVGLLLDNRDTIYPQFATHNAYSVAYVLERANGDLNGFEFQRLHGMGDGLYDKLVEQNHIPVRIYAPVGEHKSLLAYLVRRLLENGANSSFVNNIVDDAIPLESLIEDPVSNVRGCVGRVNPNIPLPAAIYGELRRNATGVDISDIPRMATLAENAARWSLDHVGLDREPGPNEMVSTNPSDTRDVIGAVLITASDDMSGKLDKAVAAHALWSAIPVDARAECLLSLSNKLEQHMDQFIALCTREAGKTAADGVAEVREAVDFCRYYANEARRVSNPDSDWGEEGILESRGVVVCISPWNFPLAIFLGQVTAALAAGNSVLAKPADSTALVAAFALELMSDCGFPADVVQLIFAQGHVVGDNLLPDSRVAAVMFTGSTAVGAEISRKLAQRPGPRIPLIAETGGQNCLIVDSTALPEQVVDDVISSGFQSAGQRCSALRVLYLQEDIADEIVSMIIGAMEELSVGNPAFLQTDVGPVIDQRALSALTAHVDYMQDISNQGKGKLLYQCEQSDECAHGTFFAPRLYQIDSIDVLQQEVFGPIVHVVRYEAKALDQTLAAINGTGFGLTCGVHSRIQATSEKLVKTIEAGNIYINRNIIGAIVGVQPFGGHGLSGTGPKAGGPSYVYRLMTQQRDKIEQSPKLSFDFGGSYTAPDVAFQRMEDTETKKLWLGVSVSRRVEMIKELVALLLAQHPGTVDSLLLNQVNLMAQEVMSTQVAPQTLQGPTGELNQLILERRGVLLCVQQGQSSITDGVRQVIAALLCGNSIIHVASQAFDFSELLSEVGMSSMYIRATVSTADQLEGMIKAPALKGVSVSGSESLSRWIDGVLAIRNGALCPLIVETNGPSLMSRFVLEKAVSNNTTASGGNASLLAMGDS